MPTAIDTFKRGPRIIDYLLIGAGMFLVFWGLNDYAPLHSGTSAETITRTRNGTSYVTHVQTVKRVVHGRVVHINDRVYIHVPVVVVHTDEHTITVPAHNLPLKSAAATVANPLVTVYVPVPTTIYVPVPTTVTVVSVSTLTVPTTITITVPVTVGNPVS